MKLQQLLAAVITLLVGSMTAGCSPYYERTEVKRYGDEPDAKIQQTVAQACGQLVASAADLDKQLNTLMVTSFAQLDKLDESSPLGRLLGQSCATEVVNRGYQVTELLMANTVYISPERGELILSRDLAYIAKDHDADRVLAGTYTVGTDKVYATIKVVRADDARVLAADDFTLPITREVQSLLAGRRQR